MNLFYVALGGAIGAVARYKLSELNSTIPYGTLIANVLGCFLIGFCFFLFNDSKTLEINQYTKTIIISGFLGALTTFSTFSLELVLFVQNGDYQKGILYLFLNLGLCLGGVMLGKKLSGFFI